MAFPAHRCKMGNWQYFISQLTMKQVASLVELHEKYVKQSNKHLSVWMQRPHEKRKALEKYISNREDRFFSSIVVGFRKGKPKFKQIDVSTMDGVKDTKGEPIGYFDTDFHGIDVGILKFSKDVELYALDGQHRLQAIKTMIKNESEYETPNGFENELVSVIFVPIESEEEEEEEEEIFKQQKYRRLFTTLNRYAKPTSKFINIILDDDDIFAILTRRLIEEHPYFYVDENAPSSFVDIKKGKSMLPSNSSFTNIEMLYDFVSTTFENVIVKSLDNDRSIKTELEQFKQLRPDEDKIDEYFEQMSNIWDAISNCFPEFSTENVGNARDPNKKETANMLFTPFGQEVLAQLIKYRTKSLDFKDNIVETSDIINCISILKHLPWKMRELPWEKVVTQLIVDEQKNEKWKMTDRDRGLIMIFVREIMTWLTGDFDLGPKEIEEYKAKWRNFGNEKTEQEANECFKELADLRIKISQG